ncbi:hypothetical protein JR316_0009277 [Psilocybe cubensis]|uniref:Uncharacterized protein n=1 Tax=Psilocybe cubensis TaxID=181762 RepID=A0ACB8GTL5_PSICU|nr:hypothetical protein JR316_0009277 [Psilocybe cubensis]KAH9478815.1 hypothetical protein JR316_0009277 [Psilocybe cubensis]
MLFATIALQCAPQTYQMTLLTITAFQRHFLEAITCYDFLTKFKDMKINVLVEPEVDASIMGCITASVDIAIEMYYSSMPVWLVQRPEEISMKTTIIGTLGFSPIPGIILQHMAGANPVFSGDASAVHNCACQALKIGNICLGHSSFMAHPGEFANPSGSYYTPLYSQPLGPTSNTPASNDCPLISATPVTSTTSVQ